jgi:hypothetical protein
MAVSSEGSFMYQRQQWQGLSFLKVISGKKPVVPISKCRALWKEAITCTRYPYFNISGF